MGQQLGFPTPEELFEDRGANPVFWALSSRSLKSSGDQLFEIYLAALIRLMDGEQLDESAGLGSVGPATLLYGLSLENILKAIIIKRSGSPLDRGRLNRRWRRDSHNLVKLMDRAGIAADDQERDLAKRLSAFVEWAGRYPIPTSDRKMMIEQRNVSRALPPLPLQPAEKQLLDELFEQLYRQIIQAA